MGNTLHLCSDELSVYAKEDAELVLFPAIPKWIMLETGGSALLKMLDGRTEEECIQIVGSKDVIEELVAYGVLIHRPLDTDIENEHDSEQIPLLAVWLNITSSCNLKCRHCFLGGSKKRDHELSAEEIGKLLDSFEKVMGPEKIDLDITGGEPLLRKDIKDILDVCLRDSCVVRIITNGLLLNEELCEYLAKNKISLLISLDGASSKTHDLLRGNGTFVQTYEKIKLALSFDVKVTLGMTVYEGNQQEVDDFIKLAKVLGVAKVNFSFLNAIGNAEENHLVAADDNRVLQHLLDLSETDPETRKMLTGGFISKMINTVYLPIKVDCCGSGINTCSIGSRGEVFPCPSFQSSRFIAGNIRESNFEDIWVSSIILSKFREMHVTKLNKECRLCDLRLLCGGGCRGNATQGGMLDFGAKNPRCSSVKKGYIDTIFRLYNSPVLGEMVSADKKLWLHQ